MTEEKENRQESRQESRQEDRQESRQESRQEDRQEEKGSLWHRIFTILGIVLGAAVLPVLVINCILLVKSQIAPEEVPEVLGLSPMIVVTESMSPAITAGDMIVVRREDPETIRVGDIICFFNPQNEEKKGVITHRVTEIIKNTDGSLSFQTKGDANNAEDPVTVPEDRLVGVYRTKIPVLGNLALFMKSTLGVLVFVVLPLMLLIAYDMIRQRAWERKHPENRATPLLFTKIDRQATMPADL